MKIVDVILILILAAIFISVGLYIRREKKKGVKCVGCPYAKNCGGNCGDK